MPIHRGIPRLAFVAAVWIALASTEAPAQSAQPEQRDTGIAGELARAPEWPASKGDYHQVAADVLDALDGDLNRVLDRALEYFVNESPDTDRDMRGWHAFIVITILFTHESDILLEWLVPRLESDEAHTRTWARELMISHLLMRHQGSRLYEKYLENHGEAASNPLLRILFERSPELAIDTIVRLNTRTRLADGNDALEPDEAEALRHIGLAIQLSWLESRGVRAGGAMHETVRASLRSLAVSEVWWARAYAATRMRRVVHKDRELIAALREDEHPVVRGLAERIPR